MKNKITLNESMLGNFLIYADERIKSYTYMTQDALKIGFNYFVDKQLTATNKGETWRILNGKKDMFSYGFSGVDLGYLCESENEIINEHLFHELFCKIEWIERSKTETFYQDTVKQFLGNSHKLFFK